MYRKKAGFGPFIMDTMQGVLILVGGTACQELRRTLSGQMLSRALVDASEPCSECRWGPEACQR